LVLIKVFVKGCSIIDGDICVVESNKSSIYRRWSRINTIIIPI
jgi:hypothetical protein